MSLKELLLRKGRGVGELKDIRKEHWLNAEIIRHIKELDEIDRKADYALHSNDYGKYFACIRQQLSIISRIDHYVDVRMVRAEYAYKDIQAMLDRADKDCLAKSRKLREEARRARNEKDNTEINAIRMSIDKVSRELHHFKLKIEEMRRAVGALRQDFKKHCRTRIVKTRKVFRFA